jgi:hypothetical protein
MLETVITTGTWLLGMSDFNAWIELAREVEPLSGPSPETSARAV